MFLYILVVTILILCFLDILLNNNPRARSLKRIPGLRDRFLVGNAFEIFTTPVELFRIGREYAKSFKGIYRYWAYPVAAVVIYNPEDIETVISSTKHNEKSFVYKFLKPWLRDGLLLSTGVKWHQRRKILTPAFHFNILKHFCPVLYDNSQRFANNLHKLSNEEVNLTTLVSEFTLSSLCETAMGTRLCNEATDSSKSYKNAIYYLGNLFVERFVRVHLYSDFIHKFSNIGRKQLKYLKVIHNFTKTVIAERKEYLKNNEIEIQSHDEDDIYISNKKGNIAFLDLLIRAENDKLIDEDGVQEEVDTFMFEGHDTTASALTMCLVALADNPDVQEKIFMELDSIFKESDRPIGMNDLKMMKYLECCINESLRLYPPVPFISRKVSEDVKLSNYNVDAGTVCHIIIYDLHRREESFKNALKFDPDRFLPENTVDQHPYAFIPFSAGPRNCIGQRFAMMEMKMVLSMLLRKFKLGQVTRPDDLKFKSDLVLRNSEPVYVKFIPRIS